MKQAAVDYLKTNMAALYPNYFREPSNEWIYELFDYDPFDFFMEVPDFTLAPLQKIKGQMDQENAKILHSNLINVSESQASDERLWAGLCHTVFYSYTRERFGYDTKDFTTAEKDVNPILSRFFFKDGVAAGIYRNSLAKCWWTGHSSYQPNKENKYEIIDCFSPLGFSTIINDLYYNYSFSSNMVIVEGIAKAWKMMLDRGFGFKIDSHFRKAIQNFNALGGAVLLDAFTSDEIKEMFLDILFSLFGETEVDALDYAETIGDIDESDTDDLELENINQTAQNENIVRMRDINPTHVPEDKIVSSNQENVKIIGKKITESDRLEAKILTEKYGNPTKVDYNTKVTVLKTSEGKTIQYSLPANSKEEGWYTIMGRLRHCKVGDEIKYDGTSYIIQGIAW